MSAQKLEAVDEAGDGENLSNGDSGQVDEQVDEGENENEKEELELTEKSESVQQEG